MCRRSVVAALYCAPELMVPREGPELSSLLLNHAVGAQPFYFLFAEPQLNQNLARVLAEQG
jgi:hypothetical protein